MYFISDFSGAKYMESHSVFFFLWLIPFSAATGFLNQILLLKIDLCIYLVHQDGHMMAVEKCRQILKETIIKS